MAAIELTGVSKTYGTNMAVREVDLALPEGAFVVILGPSGCGKSTLLRMVAGLEAINAGELRIGGARMNEREPKDRGCAMVFQNYALYPHMSVAENIGYPLKVAGLSRAERKARVAEVAGALELAPLLDRRPGQLSGGQRQRVAIGRAMVRHPKVFLFDEPLSNLDAKLRVQMRLELRRLHERLGATSVLVTHDQQEAMTLADHLVVMNAGRIEQQGTPREVYARPASLFVAGFLGAPAMNLLPAEVLASGDTVRLIDGTLLRLPEPVERRGAVMLGIRPEHVAAGGLAAKVEMVEDLGASALVHARLAGLAPLAFHSPAEAPPLRGAEVGLDLPPSRLHLFDPAGGARLPLGVGQIRQRARAEGGLSVTSASL
ncbi:sn-glycerol-3-phosphate ABC transporter ATP-binding protein UgpC [Roseomonas sp. M0104]|uniref:sn-glycerol-3-phosphate ABC transporter ATP-binding protein UgpC n=1 Tax=Teichococcus coralli TaxID=2545983 RepID=A0A845B9Z4_9PROT|nr:sn-glycerol-3-phosphate ABC transporter ATP-binding protein UgpC [Pseudoroseomonas coralli]MXP62202.1 sn-glycerol-3-phosphate ABC transporter ATP-binding protein UgpC [Pseudoroseomonas coralli]